MAVLRTLDGAVIHRPGQWSTGVVYPFVHGRPRGDLAGAWRQVQVSADLWVN